MSKSASKAATCCPTRKALKPYMVRDVAHAVPDVRRPVDVHRIEGAIRELLAAIGEDLSRDGIKDTPARVARVWREFIDYDPGTTATLFDGPSGGEVIVSDMRVWSMCEHHLLPFWCDVTVKYMPKGKVLGLSKFARIAQAHAHGLQTQERLVHGIAHEIATVTGCADVEVSATGEHLCMTMRGIKSPARMSTRHGLGFYRLD